LNVRYWSHIAFPFRAAFYLWGKYYKNKADKAQVRSDGYQAQAEIAQGRQEVQSEVAQAVEQTHERVETGDAAGLSGDFNNLK